MTGRGANSVDNIAVIRPRVVTMLAEEYADLGAVHDKNPGQLFIEAADLAAWASAASGPDPVSGRVAACAHCAG